MKNSVGENNWAVPKTRAFFRIQIYCRDGVNSMKKFKPTQLFGIVMTVGRYLLF